MQEGRRVAREGTEGALTALCDGCASYLLAIAETLSCKLELVLRRSPAGTYRSLLVAGGVAANSMVRAEAARLAERHGLALLLPSLKLCTDNGIMVAYMGSLLAREGLRHGQELSVIPRGQHIPDDFQYDPALMALARRQ